MFNLSDQTSRMRAAFLLAAAANEEAERLGHSVIDTDHQLLALIAVGGAPAQLLARHGVTLDRARTEVADMQRDHLAAVGIGAPDAAPVTPPRYMADIKTLTPAATAVSHDDQGNGLSVLARLMADPQSRSAQLLARLGVEITDAELVGAMATAVAPTGEWPVTFSAVTSAPRERVWALLDDPLRRPSWDTDVHSVEVVDDELFIGRAPVADTRLSRIIAKRFGNDVQHRLSARTPGRVIQWRVTSPRSGHTEHLRVELEGVAEGTRMTLLSRRERRDGVTAGVVGWLSDTRLRLRTQAIIQVVET